MPQLSQPAIKELLDIIAERRASQAKEGKPSAGLASIQSAFESLMAKGQGSNLFWVKPAEPELVQAPAIPVLRCLDSAGEGTLGRPAHVLIEGDNFHALQVLAHTHKGAVDVIYIDPPYNTRESGFKYNDNWVDGENRYRHSMWLSFMEKRLLLALELLSPTGALLISIDDNEYSQLKLLCDALIGQDNFHGNVTWHKRTKPINSGKARFGMQANIEYILVYTRAPKQEHAGFELLTEGERAYPHVYKGNPCRLKDILDSDEGRKKRDTMKFPVLGIVPPPGQRWKYGQDTLTKYELADRIAVVNGVPKLVIRPEDEDAGILKPFWSHFSLDSTGSAETGKATLSAIVGSDHGFDTVKPLELMKQLLGHFPDNAVILDFFAGSGTTAHAVLELNRDGGTRQCILVTDNSVDKPTQAALVKAGYTKDSPEWQAKGICRAITWPRVSSVVLGKSANGKTEWRGEPAHARFEYFKLEVEPMPLASKEDGEQVYSEADKAEARAKTVREHLLNKAPFAPIAWLEAGAQHQFDGNTAVEGVGAGFAVVGRPSELPADLSGIRVVYLLSDSVIAQPGASLSATASRIVKRFADSQRVKVKELWVDYVKNFPVDVK